MRYHRDGFSVQAAIKKKRTLPDWYLEEPPLVRGVDFFYRAFQDLQTERRTDGPIPWSATMAYARHKGLEPDVADALWIIITKMDAADRAWQLEELKRETGGG